MMVLGADTHKRSHTIAAIGAATGELFGERMVPVADAASASCCGGRAALTASGCGRLRIAGTCLDRWSGS